MEVRSTVFRSFVLDDVVRMSLYSVLGADESASMDELKQKYHKLALKYHPDRNKELNKVSEANNELFLQIQESWETLRDETKRKLYDKQLNDSKMKENNVSISYLVTLSECDWIDHEHDDKDHMINIYEYPCRCGDYFELRIDASSISKTKDMSRSITTSCPTCCRNMKCTF